jgi:hypothetical protein
VAFIHLTYVANYFEAASIFATYCIISLNCSLDIDPDSFLLNLGRENYSI